MQLDSKAIRYLLIAVGFLAIACLFSPFIFLKIGPKGYEYYGPDVPDIYILGGFILGKDISFWGISFAWKFQLIFISLFAVLSFLAVKRLNRNENISRILFIQITLLILFPKWLDEYTEGVIANSDGADLTLHYQFGCLIYLTICLTEVILFIMYMKLKSKKPTSDQHQEPRALS
ncbi:MAG: hypothetical protein ACRC3B_13875 [Bacteroidia bacterium]